MTIGKVAAVCTGNLVHLPGPRNPLSGRSDDIPNHETHHSPSRDKAQWNEDGLNDLIQSDNRQSNELKQWIHGLIQGAN